MAIRKRVGKKGVSWQIDYLDPSGRRVRQSFKKRKDAEAELGKRISLMAEKRYLDIKKDYTTTFGELINKYTENFKHQKSFSSAKGCYLPTFKKHFGEHTLLTNIRYVDLVTYQTALRTRLTKAKTIRTVAAINREIQCLSNLFRKGVEWEMIEQNPFDRGAKLTLKENNKRTRFLTDEEIERLLSECKRSPHLHHIVFCALNTGMRRGEILGLKWEQIRNGFIYLVDTKTKEPRQIPINDDLAVMFKEIRQEQELTSPYVFTYAGRKLFRVDSAFRAAMRRAGITGFRFNDLRHTFASQLVIRGANLKEVQELLGHKTMNMTLRYAHLAEENKKTAVSLLNGMATVTKLSQIQNQPSNPPLSLVKN